MMVDDHHIAFGRAPAHLGDEAALPLRAFRADAILRAGIQPRPQLTAFGQRRQLRAISGRGGLLPLADGAIVLDFLQPGQDRRVGKVVELLAAEIIVAALHVADPQPPFALPLARPVLRRHSQSGACAEAAGEANSASSRKGTSL